jgi:arabinofuranosyltransferase
MKTASRPSVEQSIAVLCVTALLLHLTIAALLQGPWCIDDAYISFRYARNLGRGMGLVWNPGELVDGYTNFAWVIFMTPFEVLGLNTPVIARLVSGVCAVAIVVVMMRFASKQIGAGAATVPGLLMVLDGALGRWGQDGLETTAFTLVLLVACLTALRAWEEQRADYRVPLLFGLLTLLRPDGGLFFAVTIIFGVATRRQSLRAALGWCGLFLLVVLPWASWRWLYYGYPLPNTFYAKVGLSSAVIERGLRYIGTAAQQRLPALLLIAVAVFRNPGRAGVRFFLCLCAAQLVFVVAVGGDWMGPSRFILPILPLLYLLAATPLSPLKPVVGRHLALAITGIALFFHFMLTSTWSELSSLARERDYLSSRASVSQWLDQAAAADDTILLGEIGQIGYGTDRVVYDIFGLVDAHIAHQDAPTLGHGKPGHEKSDLSYSMSLRPDWVVLPPKGLVPQGYEEVRIPPEFPVARASYRRLLRRRD